MYINNRKYHIKEDRSIESLPQYIQDLIPIIRERFKKYQGAWNAQQIGDLFTREAKLDTTSTRILYKKELIEIGFTPDIYEFERIQFGGEYSRSIGFYINILTNKKKLHVSHSELGYFEKFESIRIDMSLICQKYSVMIFHIDEAKGSIIRIRNPQTQEDQKIFNMIDIFMKKREYELIKTELLDIPLPMKGELNGIPDDIYGSPSGYSFTVSNLLFGE